MLNSGQLLVESYETATQQVIVNMDTSLPCDDALNFMQ